MFNQVVKYRFWISLIILCVFYTVGIVLLVNGGKESDLIELTPLTILLTTFILLFNHEHWSKGIAVALFSIVILGLGIEIIGVNYGIPFGEYSYSHVLGIHLLDTPIIMGFNWVMLVYAGVLTIHSFVKNKYLKAVLAGLLLVGLDVLIEPVAIEWNMWTWKLTSVPIQNYLTWGIAAVIFSFILSAQLKPENKNKIALPVLLLQFIFFIILG